MNIPNKISIARILLIPAMLLCYLMPWGMAGKISALCIFVFASLTDWVDGYIARKYNLVTDLGKFLDPIADKLLSLGGILLVVCDGTIKHPFGLLIVFVMVAREFIVALLRQIAATKKVVIAADKLGKLKTVAGFFLIPIFMFLAVNAESLFLSESVLKIFEYTGYFFAGLFTALTTLSGANYVIKNKQAFK